MRELSLGQAIDAAIEDAMANDETIVLIGEDIHLLRAPIYARFGAERVLNAPISEAAFLGAAGGAAMGGLRPVVELYMVDFLAVAFDALLNHIAKLAALSGDKWQCPLLLRAPCGAGYGDGGQHGQVLWGMLAQIPGLSVVVPSTPTDAYAVTRAALSAPGPVVLLEPKLLSEEWLAFLGRGGRNTLEFDVPAGANSGPVGGDHVVASGAILRREGGDLSICSMGVGVHRALAAAELLQAEGSSCDVLDLRWLRPLDVPAVVNSVRRTGRLLVVDEDYRECGVAAELAACALEAGLTPRFARVCVEGTLPYDRTRETAALPNVDRICAAARQLMQAPASTLTDA